MDKVYIVTDGEYSDYSIRACFSNKEKAEEYIKILQENGLDRYSARIEEYDLDVSVEAETLICVSLQSPILNENLKEEKIKTWNFKGMSNELTESTCLLYSNYELHIARKANPNKSLESEINRVKKVAYDTLKRINYLMKVEKVKIEDINEYLKKEN